MASRPAPLAAGLYVVATPIGNLRDITLRALDVLAGVDLVLAEDTRVAGRLLSAHGLSRPLERYDDHAGARARPAILERLAGGARIALTSDAGTPLVSDPGYRLVVEAAAQGTPVFPVPGACAAIAALSVAALPTDRFVFAGFPPAKSVARRAFFAELAPIRSTLIFYEGISRLAASLADMAQVFGARPAAVARELTKLHETVIRASLGELAADPRLSAAKGEAVIVVGPGPERAAATDAEADAALAAALEQLSPARAAAQVASACGRDRRELYLRALALQDRARR
ncbi:MAG TPA: 16S rRNA (cytidine(1402)-2'-O)-methyltransferase [Caulobacteraceae bacterium]|nr:16S rRNA (cytidine(1402)-2'-O)-methyltransferase [Caulobacteraceae bacterium]